LNAISIITAVRNRADTIGGAVLSIRTQGYESIEHIIIDGASSDGTVDQILSITENNNHSCVIVSEPDNGVYDAINKGIRISTSDVIGLLHSDDVFAEPNTITKVMNVFEADPNVDIVYGDLLIIDHDLQKPIRYWKTGEFHIGKLQKGWMPPHPTLFLRKRVFDEYGMYDTSFRVSADYDFTLRIFKSGTLNTHYIPEVMVHMRSGGLSSQNYLSIIKEDYRAVKKNDIGGVFTLACKYTRVLLQYFGAYRARS
jgi:glycosyltransferase involved in cell wall biosynthesis